MQKFQHEELKIQDQKVNHRGGPNYKRLALNFFVNFRVGPGMYRQSFTCKYRLYNEVEVSTGLYNRLVPWGIATRGSSNTIKTPIRHDMGSINREQRNMEEV